MPDTQEPRLTPYCVCIDSREQFPFPFVGYRCDARDQYRPLIIRTKVEGLRTGDYSLEGFEEVIAIERKSLSDAYSTFCQGRERFERELERLDAMPGFAAVVVEAGWPTILNSPPPHTKFSPKSFYRSVKAWQIRYRGVHWEFWETRSMAERATLRLLERYYFDDQERKKKESQQ